MQTSLSKKSINTEKSKKNEPSNNDIEEEKSLSNEPEKEKIFERFIYITNYYDSDFLAKIKLLFEEINQKAFNLSSPKEINTHSLSEEERQNNDIDYISGFQLLDNQRRITIIEGIAGKAMQKIKDAFPRTQMNNETKMIFADSNILYDKKIYSKFDLSLKFIKTRESLNQILTTFDIYLKSTNYREIYDAFLNIGSILKSVTLKEITDENLFPDAEGLLLLERKYGDILKEEDLTGIKKEKVIKKKYLITTKNFSSTNNDKNQTTKLLFSNNDDDDKNNNNNIIKSNNDVINNKNPIFKKLVKNALNLSLNNSNTKDNIDIFRIKYDRSIAKTEPNLSYDKRMLNIAPKIRANNEIFNDILKNRSINLSKGSIDPDKILQRNLEDIKNIKRRGKFEKFWKPDKSPHDPNKKIYFYAIRANHYDEVVNRMRERYLKDKNHFYSYSNYSLALSFPMSDRYRNEEYIKYMDNKSKWISKNDFDRFKQPEREKIYFPRINKEI